MDETSAGKNISVAALGSAVFTSAYAFVKNSWNACTILDWKIFFCFLSQQLVACAFDFQQHRLRRNQCQRGFHLIVRAEWIAPAMNK